MNGNEVCVLVVGGRGCRLVSRILPPQLFDPEFGGKGALTRGKRARGIAIGLENDLCLERSSSLSV